MYENASHNNKTRWLVFFTLDTQTYIRYNCRYRTNVLIFAKRFIVLAVHGLQKIRMCIICISENNIWYIQTHRFRNPLCENLIVSRGYWLEATRVICFRFYFCYDFLDFGCDFVENMKFPWVVLRLYVFFASLRKSWEKWVDGEI